MSEQEPAEGLEAEIEATIAKEESAPPIVEEIEETQEGETEPEVDEEPPVEKPDGFQKRINKVTADKHRERQRAETAERENEQLRSQLRPVEAEPQLEDFDYDEAKHNRALLQHFAKQEVQTLRQESENQNRGKAQKQVQAEHDNRVDTANIPDYSEKVETLVLSFTDQNNPMPQAMVESLQLDDKGPEVTAYLSEHLDKAHDIAAMHPLRVAAEIGKISARLSAQKPKKTTNAPDPIKTAGSGGSSKKDINSPDAVFTMAELEAILYK